MAFKMEKLMGTDIQTGTDLALPNQNSLVAAFRAPDDMARILERIEREARSQVADVTTKKGRDAIASLAYKIAKSKTHMDEAGKALNESARAQINIVDAERRKIRERLDALKDEVRKPLTDWEAAEETRVAALKGRLDRVAKAADMLPPDATAEQIGALLSRLEGVAIDESWAEFIVPAATAKDASVSLLRTMLAKAQKAEAEAAELARLRAAEADRLARELAEREAREAEERRMAAEKAEADRQARIEQEARDREARAAAEAEARAKAEAARLLQEASEREAARLRQAKEAEERHARELAEAKAREAALERKAADEKAAAEARAAQALADARAAADKAAQDERDRIAAQATAEAVARAKREADTAHRAKIKANIVAALEAMKGAATPDAIAEALMAGKIPHCRVEL